MSKRFLERDDFLGLTHYHEYDHTTKETRIITESDDVAPALSFNKTQLNDGDLKRKQFKNGMIKIGSIPAGVQLEWKAKYGIDVYNPKHIDRVMKLLHDRDWSHLRTVTGNYI